MIFLVLFFVDLFCCPTYLRNGFAAVPLKSTIALIRMLSFHFLGLTHGES